MACQAVAVLLTPALPPALLTLLPIKGHGIENGNAQIQGVQEAPLSISFTHSVVTLLCFQTRRSSLVSLILFQLLINMFPNSFV